jgi:hypothetical protein
MKLKLLLIGLLFPFIVSGQILTKGGKVTAKVDTLEARSILTSIKGNFKTINGANINDLYQTSLPSTSTPGTYTIPFNRSNTQIVPFYVSSIMTIKPDTTNSYSGAYTTLDLVGTGIGSVRFLDLVPLKSAVLDSFLNTFNYVNAYQFIKVGKYTFLYEKVSYTLLPDLKTVLSTPTGMGSEVGSETELFLYWNAYTGSATSLIIEYSLDQITWFTLDTVSPSSSTYIHDGLTNNTLYYYRMRAIGDPTTYSPSGYAITSNTTHIVEEVDPPTDGDYYVNYWRGSDSNPGSLASPFKTIEHAWSVAGSTDLIYVKGGMYPVQNTTGYAGLSLGDKNGADSTNKIKVFSYPGEKVILNCAGMTRIDDGIVGLRILGNNIHVKGFEIINVPQYRDPAFNNFGHYNVGVNIAGNYCTLENCVSRNNMGTGINIGGTATGTYLYNCDVRDNFDPYTSQAADGVTPYPGGDADGIHITVTGTDNRNYVRGCRMYNNSDDGIDCFNTDSHVFIDSCWSFHNGYILNGSTASSGDGTGIKLGRTTTSYNALKKVITNCVTAYNRSIGYTQNAGTTIIHLYNNLSFNDGGFAFDFGNTFTGQDQLELINNIAIGTNGNYLPYAVQEYNSWQLSGTIDDSDFISVDTSLLRATRQDWGGLPINNVFRLASGSELIDGGIHVGYGDDLGPFQIGAVPPYVAMPRPNISSSVVSSGTTVSLSTTAPSATIYYTTNGTTPTTSSSVYSSPISITSSTTLKSIAVNTVGTSGVNTSYYAVLNSTYQTVYDALIIKPSVSYVIAQNTMVENLVSAGIWSKLDAFYWFAQPVNTNGEAKVNWKNPGTYTAVASSTVPWTALEGYGGDPDAEAIVRIDINLSTFGGNYSLNSASMGVYTRSLPTVLSPLIAVRTGTEIWVTSTSLQVGINGSSSYTETASQTAGYWAVSRTSSTSFYLMHNSTDTGDKTNSSSSLPNTTNIQIFARQGSYFGDAQVSMAFIGGGLTKTELITIYNETQACLTSVGKQL